MPINLSAKNDFHGVWPDVLVPLHADLSIDEARLSSHLRNLSAKGVEKFLLFGHAGEGASFSAEEKLSALAHVIASGIEAKDLLLGVYASSFSDAAHLIRKAYEQGVRRFLLSAPLFYAHTSHGALLDFYEQVISRVNLNDWQLFVHQLGSTSHAGDLPEVTLTELRKSHPTIFVGIVDQDKHVNHTVDLIRSFGSEIPIASCHEPNLSILKPSVCISALANVVPNILRHIIANDLPVNGSQMPGMKVVKPDDRVVELMNVIGEYPPIAAMKLMLAQHHRQGDWEHVRPPQAKLSKEGREALMKAFNTFNLLANE